MNWFEDWVPNFEKLQDGELQAFAQRIHVDIHDPRPMRYGWPAVAWELRLCQEHNMPIQALDALRENVWVYMKHRAEARPASPN